MDKQELFDVIDEKKIDRKEIADWILDEQEALSFIFEGLKHKKANIKYGCEKVLRILSDTAPEVLYQHYDVFVSNLSSDNKFLRLGAIIVLANLSSVDSEDKLKKISDQYFSILTSGDLTATGNVIKSVPRIVSNKPEYESYLTTLLLNIPEVQFENDECLNIAIGHTLDTFGKLHDKETVTTDIERFVIDQLNNPRPFTKKKAEKMVQKFGIAKPS